MHRRGVKSDLDCALRIGRHRGAAIVGLGIRGDGLNTGNAQRSCLIIQEGNAVGGAGCADALIGERNQLGRNGDVLRLQVHTGEKNKREKAVTAL